MDSLLDMFYGYKSGKMGITWGSVLISSIKNKLEIEIFILCDTVSISMRAWFSGKIPPCQGGVGSSILPARTNNIVI